MTREIGHQRPRRSAGRGAENQSSDILALPNQFADDFDRLALADDDVRLDPRGIDNLADGRGDRGFDAQGLLFLDRRLDAALLDEILRLDDCQHFDRALGLGSAPRGEAECDARLIAVVDHDQIRPFVLIAPNHIAIAARIRGDAQAPCG